MEITIDIFDAKHFSTEQHARLEELLNTLDVAVNARRKFKDAAFVEALQTYAQNPNAPAKNADYISLFNSIPDDRMPQYIQNEIRAIDNSENVAAQIEKLPVAEQKKVIGLAAGSYTDLLDQTVERIHWSAVDKIYEQILTEFPAILNNEDDIKAACNLGAIIGEQKSALITLWRTGSDAQKVDAARSLVAKAYPNDNIDRLAIVLSAKGKGVAAAYLDAVDVITCGPYFSKQKLPILPLYLFSHEYQHRRQQLMVERLEQNQLAPATTEYYQARLFRANFKGGYLSHTIFNNFITRTAKATDYLEQPVEAQANYMAKLAHKIAGTHADKLWAMNESLTKAFSAVARPVDKVMFAVSNAVSFGKGLIGIKR